MFSLNVSSSFEIILRTAAVYLFIVVAIRLFGKKELSQLSTSDLVFILLISNAVQNAMVGPGSTLEGGLLAALTLFILNYLFKLIMYKSKAAAKLIEGSTDILIYKGVINEHILKREFVTKEELEAVVREHGIQHTSDVELAVLERDGNISVVSKELVGQTFHKRDKKSHPKLQKNN